MSWAENEKLNEWIERAYQNGKREEQERIFKMLEDNSVIRKDFTDQFVFVDCNTLKVEYLADSVINGDLTKCECDTCDNPDCDCRGRRCSFCLGQDENR
jgi:hypothetical protein